MTILFAYLAGVCAALCVTATMQLGRHFCMRAVAPRTLVTTGLYTRLRHPIYLFSLLHFAFLLLALGWYRGLWLVPPLVLQPLLLNCCLQQLQ